MLAKPLLVRLFVVLEVVPISTSFQKHHHEKSTSYEQKTVRFSIHRTAVMFYKS